MGDKPENPIAFPAHHDPDSHAGHGIGGMSLRDWFAGQALAGLMSNENTPFSADVADVEPRQIAGAVYEIANAMLAERLRHD